MVEGVFGVLVFGVTPISVRCLTRVSVNYEIFSNYYDRLSVWVVFGVCVGA